MGLSLVSLSRPVSLFYLEMSSDSICFFESLHSLVMCSSNYPSNDTAYHPVISFFLSLPNTPRVAQGNCLFVVSFGAVIIHWPTFILIPQIMSLIQYKIIFGWRNRVLLFKFWEISKIQFSDSGKGKVQSGFLLPKLIKMSISFSGTFDILILANVKLFSANF